jgi:hypothetical protein
MRKTTVATGCLYLFVQKQLCTRRLKSARGLCSWTVHEPQFTYFKKFLVATQLDKDAFPCNLNSVHNLPAIYSTLLLFYHLLSDIMDTYWEEAAETTIWMQIFFILCVLHLHPTLLITIF